MGLPGAGRGPYVLEVERKFRSLAVRELTREGGVPAFASLRKLPCRVLRDAYYDRASQLSSAGAWVRKRNGEWEAKIKQGGDFTNSRFREICGAGAIAEHVGSITGRVAAASENFGLEPTAEFTTRRETWIANGRFHVVLDRMDFGHEVGEVELQQEVEPDSRDGAVSEALKQSVLQDLDDKISDFMKRYKWAFSPGSPKGKLTAYFELKEKNNQQGGG